MQHIHVTSLCTQHSPAPYTLHPPSPSPSLLSSLTLISPIGRCCSCCHIMSPYYAAGLADRLAISERPEPLRLLGVERSTQNALRQAGLTQKDIDIFELHDAYTIMACLSLEVSAPPSLSPPTRAHAHTYTRIDTYTHTFTHIHTRTLAHTCIQAHVHIQHTQTYT